jgi:hypothetical protein
MVVKQSFLAETTLNPGAPRFQRVGLSATIFLLRKKYFRFYPLRVSGGANRRCRG